MLNLHDIQNEIENIELEDQSVSTGGNFPARRIPMGLHPARLVRYIELGDHPQKAYQGVDKDDAPMVALTFEFLGKKTVTEATEEKPEYAMQKTIVIKKSSHEKATYRKLFDKMRAGDTTITNMLQMVGVGKWLMKVEWTQNNKVLKAADVEAAEAKSKAEPDNKELKIWDSIRNDTGYMITAPYVDKFDEETGETATVAVPVREPISGLAAFIWETPNPKFWASIHIEGSYTKTVNGKEEEVSKNRWQNMCIEATNYNGSALQTMLDGTDAIGAAVIAETPEEEKPTKEEKAAEPVAAATPSEEDDLMADLGL